MFEPNFGEIIDEDDSDNGCIESRSILSEQSGRFKDVSALLQRAVSLYKYSSCTYRNETRNTARLKNDEVLSCQSTTI